MNKALLVGKVTNSPRVSPAPYNPDEKIARLMIETNKHWTDNENNIKVKTTMHRVLFKKDQASVIEQYVQSDSCIGLEGELKTDGSYSSEIVANKLYLMPVSQSDDEPSTSDVISEDSVNEIIISGRAGGDPETTSIESVNSQITKFSLATTKTWKKDDQKQEKTVWHTVYTMRDRIRSQMFHAVKKGKYCVVRGELSTRKVESQDGSVKYISEINAQKIVVIRNNYKNTSTTNVSDANENNNNDTLFVDDQIPFDAFDEGKS